ncbi:MAG: hypothetical protein KME54_28365, partial [Tolypothrix brevis GSE-NOS-MK-07-07A]|nr:hypothetical protein [Tolypothrix brevis GSE-NOS-MK-07-07A]
VNGSLVNSGLLQGRGVAVGTNRSAAVRLFRGDEITSNAVFNGDIDNSGTLVAENNAAVVIQANVQLNGSIINTGTIEGGAFNNGKLAIDASSAVLSVRVNNQGTINGDVLLSAGNDIYNSYRGTTNGTVEGGAGDDILSGGDGNYTLNGGDGNDFLSGRSGTHFFVGGKGDDTIDLTRNQGIDTVVYNSGDGRDTVNNFTQGVGSDLLSFTDAADIDVVVNGSSTWFRISDRLNNNNGFGTGDVLLTLNGTTGFTADNIGANLASTNKANFLFA